MIWPMSFGQNSWWILGASGGEREGWEPHPCGNSLAQEIGDTEKTQRLLGQARAEENGNRVEGGKDLKRTPQPDKYCFLFLPLESCNQI